MSNAKLKDIYDEIDLREVYESGPFSQPEDAPYNANPTHPRYDTGLDEQEIYDEGLASAAGVGEFAAPAFKDRLIRHSRF